MAISPNAAPGEISSPFFLKNENFCLKWEDFVLKHNGEIKGKYNAWSFHLFAKISTEHTWAIRVKKSTFSNGGLLLSSKHQNLQEILTLKTLVKNTNQTDFLIRQSNFFDRLTSRKKIFRHYRFIGEIIENAIPSLLINTLKHGFENKSIYEVKFEGGNLTITFQHQNDWFKMVEKILSIHF